VVLSSAEIAQMNGAFAEQHAHALRYASLIGEKAPTLYGGMNPQMNAEGLAGAALSRGAAIGAPVAAAGLALAGLDPFSLGLRSGVAAYGAGAGVGGATLAGAAVAAPAALGLGAVSYMGGQMLTGASQTGAFNQNMQSAFRFTNPGNLYGGRGFAHGDLREIGSLVRSLGASGEQGFDELGRLAAEMGRMGFAEGVRNAKQFGEKFRQLLQGVKTIARELGTTLEEAEKAMASMRGSGIFSRQTQVAGRIREGSVAGGLATTEVTGMMHIGSQVSRLLGGTGRAGALGGIEAITQIGVARQAGIVSEEDIYNATGLTGAEGRRAAAVQQLEASGNFLRSSKGRWFLAAVAGRNGELDPESVTAFAGGGMSVQETRGRARRNLGRIGRANFIRNEGRLRGAVLEQFGGLAPALALSQWAGERGIDIHETDDRSMLFAQRQLGLGRDEADLIVRMARRLPELLRARRTSRGDDATLREQGERLKTTGLEGIKQRFEKAKNAVNNEMQRVGQDVLNVASDTIARWANRLADTYEERSIAGLREAFRAASLGGAGGERLLGGLLGGKGPSDPGLRSLVQGSRAVQSAMSAREDIGEARRGEVLRELRFSANMGELGELSRAGREFATAHRDSLRRAYAQGGIAGLGGEDRISAIRQILRQQGGAASEEFRKMSEGERATFVQQLERQIGIGQGARIGDVFAEPGLPELRGGAGPRTVAEFHQTRGRELLGLGRSRGARAADALGGVATGALGAPVALASTVAGAAEGLFGGEGFFAGAKKGLSRGLSDLRRLGQMGGDLVEETSGRAKRARAASELLDSDEGRQMLFGLVEGQPGSVEAAQDEAVRLQARTARGEKLTDEEVGRLGIVQRGLLAADLHKAVSRRGGLDKMTDRDWDELVSGARRIIEREGGDASSVDRNTVRRMYGEVAGAASKQQQVIVSRIASQVRKTSLERGRELRAGGLAELGDKGLVLSSKARERLLKEGGQGAVRAAELAIEAEAVGARVLGREDSTEADRLLLRRQAELSGDVFERLGGMSEKELRALARGTAGSELGSLASEELLRGKRMRSLLRRARSRGGGAGEAIATELGLGLSEDELRGLKGLSAEEMAARLSGRLGAGSDETFRSGLAQAIEAAQGKGPQAAQRASSLLSRAVTQADKSTRDKIAEAQGRGPDPIEKLAEKIGQGNRFLEALVKSNADARAALHQIASNTGQTDAEKG
jgi:hypothetical protein